MSKTSSFAHQISELFTGNLAIGQSRDQAKEDMRADGRDPRGMGDNLHSWGSFHAQMKAAITVFKDIKAKYRAQTKLLSDVTPSMIQQIFADYRVQGLAANTLVTRQTALRRLQQIALKKGVIQRPFMPKNSLATRQFSPRGAYTPGEAQAIIKTVACFDPAAARVLRLMSSGGLRLREAIWLRADTIYDRKARVDRLGVDIRTGSTFVEGKGGRQRQVEVLDKTALHGLDLDKKYPLRDSGMKEQSQMRRIQESLQRACKELNIRARGTHALRAGAAREYYARQLADGRSDQQARQMLAWWLGHNRTSVLRHYLEGTED